MQFTFGICVTNDNKIFHKQIIDSILKQNIPQVQIIFIGEYYEENNVEFIAFNEDQKSGWITKKKNLITQFSKFDNIVYMHDYIKLNDDWYSGFKNFPDFKVCMTRVENADGKRNLDWFINYEDLRLPNAEQLLPYSYTQYSKLMYMPGFYWIAKKSVMQEFPLNENLTWGQAEDIEWSRRVREKYDFSINPNSSVKFLKQKEYILREMSQESLNILKQI
jgi:hypothetical protein